MAELRASVCNQKVNVFGDRIADSTVVMSGMGPVPGSAPALPVANKEAYLAYHRAIESVRLCEGRSFTQDQAEATSKVIDRAANTVG